MPPVELIYLVFTRMPGESYRRRVTSLLLCLCDIFLALMDSLVCNTYHANYRDVLLHELS